jgi:type II secretory pathway pseudopilin PulG
MRHSFTRVELLVVIVAIATSIGVVLPAVVIARTTGARTEEIWERRMTPPRWTPVPTTKKVAR